MRNIVERILETHLKHHRRSCPPNITDLVFLEIEKGYRGDYDAAVQFKDKDTINKFIGKSVREHWNLKNIGRCKNPISTLIDSYEKHSN